MSQPDPNQNPFQASSARPPQQPASEGDSTGGLIPYKNMPALLAYYLGLLSLLPCIGVIPGVAAFVLGIIGLRRRAANPAIKGSVHAWIGIVLGGLFGLIWAVAILVGLVGAVAGARQ